MSEPTSAVQTGDKIIYNEDEMRRAISRIAHEILERNAGARDLVLIGLRTRGGPLAERLASRLAELEDLRVPTASLDATPYRDDLPERSTRRGAAHEPLNVPIAGQVVVLVDDGRPRKVQLAVMVDRGHRELPIRADYVGKNVPTARNESIRVCLRETDGVDAVLLRHQPE